MNARDMKKHILATALLDHLYWFEAADIDAAYYQVAMALDLDSSVDVSDAQYKRYLRVLRDMADNAQDKLNA